jgi:hypothetical protein
VRLGEVAETVGMRGEAMCVWGGVAEKGCGVYVCGCVAYYQLGIGTIRGSVRSTTKVM